MGDRRGRVWEVLNAGHIYEVRYLQWLTKACLKDSYPLPSIDVLVNGASRNQIFSMMAAHSGYNQILMHEPNEDKSIYSS